jgi:short-subunit dehydrogenase
VAALIAQVEADAGPIDVLVNNAGYAISGPFTDEPDAELRRITEINYLAPAALCRQVIPGMLRRGCGHIVNISSMAGFATFPGLVSYSASKAALTQFTSGLGVDLRGLPIGTTLVELGPIPTDMLAQADDYKPTAESFQRLYQLRLLAKVPRETVADEVVAAVRKNRRHVRIPKRAILFSMACNMPRRATALALTGVPHRSP